MAIKEVFSINQTKGKVFWLSLVLVVLAAGGYYYFFMRGSGTVEYTTAAVTHGNLVNKVSATGTMQAVTTVQVGSQASGTISAIYADFNSEVHKGQVVAELDPASLQASVQQSEANLQQSNASHEVALANLQNAKAQLAAARSNVQNQSAGVVSAQGNLKSLKATSDDALSLLKKQQALFAEGIISQRDVEVAETGYKTAQARYEQAQAQLNQAQITQKTASGSGVEEAQAAVAQMQSQVQVTEAQIKQQQAAVNLARINLSHTTITSPIDGVVVSRQVYVGQTVAASLSAPTLFTIANDLRQMQVMANIDEADIGSINQASKVSFTVDAFPGSSFEGKINQMRLNSTVVQNVVTYSVVVSVDNPDQKLKPGMTASLTFIISERDNVVKIPNSAFRVTPARGSGGGGGGGNRGNRNAPPLSEENQNAEAAAEVTPPTAPVLPGQTRIIWTVDANKVLHRHKIKIGISDGTATEMVEGDLQDGDLIVTAETTSGTPRTGNAASAPGFGGGATGGGRPPGR